MLLLFFIIVLPEPGRFKSKLFIEFYRGGVILHDFKRETPDPCLKRGIDEPFYKFGAKPPFLVDWPYCDVCDVSLSGNIPIPAVPDDLISNTRRDITGEFITELICI
jgi:hypothetical protein